MPFGAGGKKQVMAKEDIVQPVVGVAELVEALKALKGDDDELLQKKAKYDAEATRKALHPENEFHPGISVFNPLGEREHPKPPLACEMFWVGYPENAECLTPEEVAMFNALERVVFKSGFTDVNGQGVPCRRFRCTKTDGSPLPVEVTGQIGEEKMLRLMVWFPAKGDNKLNLPSKTNMLRQMTGLLDPERAADLEEIARLKKELAALSR